MNIPEEQDQIKEFNKLTPFLIAEGVCKEELSTDELNRLVTLATICEGMRVDLYGFGPAPAPAEIIERIQKKLNDTLEDYQDDMISNVHKHVGEEELNSYDKDNVDELIVRDIVNSFAEAVSKLGLYLSTLPSNDLQDKVMSIMSQGYKELADCRLAQQAENIRKFN